MNNKIIFIADCFVNDVLGGGELNNEELIKSLISRDWEIEKKYSSTINVAFLKKNEKASYIISNFIGLNSSCKDWLTENAKYCIYEHDHKYVKSRNPALYKNFKAPNSEIVNYKFYKNAVKIFCQSNFHKEIILSNLDFDNVFSLGGNLWSEESLQIISDVGRMKKNKKYSIMDSNILHKNTAGAIQYCKNKNFDYELIKNSVYKIFLQDIGKNEKLIFLPKTPETLSRVVVECRMMGMGIITNDLVGATSEDWFKLKGDALIEVIRKKKNNIIGHIEEEFLFKKTNKKVNPLISIVSTFYEGEKFLEGLLEDIIQQTIFDKCELILVDTASPGEERKIVEKYTQKYPNIKYIRYDTRFDATEGTNLAIKHSTGKFITIANIDDRRHPEFLEECLKEITKENNIDLIYVDCIEVNVPNLKFENIPKDEIKNYSKLDHSNYEFSRENMIKCLPGPMPFWSRKINEHCGFFNEKYKYANDWLMWLQSVDAGFKFKKINKILGLYLKGGRSQQNDLAQRREEASIFFKYRHIFGYNVTKRFTPYFSQFTS
jgi:glycosyltransferase involved in cell wall biosynthesis